MRRPTDTREMLPMRARLRAAAVGLLALLACSVPVAAEGSTPAPGQVGDSPTEVTPPEPTPPPPTLPELAPPLEPLPPLRLEPPAVPVLPRPESIVQAPDLRSPTGLPAAAPPAQSRPPSSTNAAPRSRSDRAARSRPPAATTRPPDPAAGRAPSGARDARRVDRPRRGTRRPSPLRAVPPPAPARSPATTARGTGLDDALRDLGEAAERLVSYIPLPVRVALVAGLLAALALLAMLVRERRRSRRVERIALRDPLTGLPNRLAFDHRSALDWERAKRYGRALGVLVLDVDGFKAVNDAHGHRAGDCLLQDVAHALAGRVRRSDLLARLGGDEFVVLTEETSRSGLEALARSLEEAVDGLPVEGLSIGWAQREPDDAEFCDVLHRADTAMYRHKHGQRGSARRDLVLVDAPGEPTIAALRAS